MLNRKQDSKHNVKYHYIWYVSYTNVSTALAFECGTVGDYRIVY